MQTTDVITMSLRTTVTTNVTLWTTDGNDIILRTIDGIKDLPRTCDRIHEMIVEVNDLLMTTERIDVLRRTSVIMEILRRTTVTDSGRHVSINMLSTRHGMEAEMLVRLQSKESVKQHASAVSLREVDTTAGHHGTTVGVCRQETVKHDQLTVMFKTFHIPAMTQTQSRTLIRS